MTPRPARTTISSRLLIESGYHAGCLFFDDDADKKVLLSEYLIQDIANVVKIIL